MKTLLATTAIALVAGSAVAADLGVAPLFVKAPAVVYNWTGFYAGINAGGGWGTTQTAGNSASVGSSSASLGGLAISNDALQGLLAGAQVGYNYQFSGLPIVAGLEGEGDWFGVQGTTVCAPGVIVGCSQTDKVKWMDDVAGRVGYAFGNFLPYVKGGVAWADIDHSFRVPVGNLNSGADFVTGSTDNIRTGWLIGAGLEYGISQHLSAKLEWNYFDFGSSSQNVNFTGPSLGNRAVTIGASFKDQVQTFKGGLNYRF